MNTKKTYRKHVVEQIAYITIVLGSAGYYLYNWFTLPNFIFPETPAIIYNFTEDGSILWKDIIKKCFNLRMIEAGRYRPRIGAFLLQYVDEKIWIYCNSKFEWWGGHYPLVIICCIMVVVIFAAIIKSIMPSVEKSKALIFGTTLLFTPHFLALSFAFVRTGKIMVLPFSFGLIYILRKGVDNAVDSKVICWIRILILSICIFLIITVDEQLIVILLVLLGILLIECFEKKKVNQGIIIGGLALLLYAGYYLYWGRILFEKYTDVPITRHQHNFYDIIKTPKHLIDGGVTFYRALLWVFWDNRFFTLLFIIISIAMVILESKWKIRIIYMYLIACAWLLFAMMISSHTAVYSDETSAHGLYSMGAVAIIIYATLYLCVNIIYEKKINEMLVNRVGIVISIIYICISIMKFQDLSSEYAKDLRMKQDAIDIMVNNVIYEDFFSGVMIYQEQYDEYKVAKINEKSGKNRDDY